MQSCAKPRSMDEGKMGGKNSTQAPPGQASSCIPARCCHNSVRQLHLQSLDPWEDGKRSQNLQREGDVTKRGERKRGFVDNPSTLRIQVYCLINHRCPNVIIPRRSPRCQRRSRETRISGAPMTLIGHVHVGDTACSKINPHVFMRPGRWSTVMRGKVTSPKATISHPVRDRHAVASVVSIRLGICMVLTLALPSRDPLV